MRKLVFPSVVIPVQPITTACRYHSGVQVAALRADLVDPLLGGNKYFKLKYNLQAAAEQGHHALLSFGGPWSNHLHAVAAAGQCYGFATIGVVRGEAPAVLNACLRDAVEMGMHLHFASRGDYRRKDAGDFQDRLRRRFGDFFLIPESDMIHCSRNAAGVRPCAALERFECIVHKHALYTPLRQDSYDGAASFHRGIPMYQAIFFLSLFLLSPGVLMAAEPPGKLVIAHRGASGYLPEHTLEAKVLAFAQGADYLEQDVVMTADDELIVFHDLTLERTTDVSSRFPGRARDDGSWYVIDFTLAELRLLAVTEATVQVGGITLPQFPGRFPLAHSRFGIHTLREELELIAGLGQSTGRAVGIYPELKAPWFHHQEGKDLARAVLAVLQDFGYASREAPVFLQSFDHNELVRVREQLLPALGMDLRLVQLVAGNDASETFEPGPDGSWVPYDYAWMHMATGLRELAAVVDGIGPAYTMLVTPGSQPGDLQIGSLTADAHAAGLLVHPYTFRSDAGRLPAYVNSFDELLELFLFTVGVDGIFTDFPDKAVQFLQSRN